MSLSPTVRLATPTTTLGVPGYTFGDLHDPERLASLYERFCEDVEAADPELWHEWEAYRSAPDAPRPPITLSNLLVAMAVQVSRFVTGLFQVQPSVDALTAITRDQDDLFRFKVDCIRRRVLPLVKAGADVVSTPEDERVVAKLIADLAGAHTGSQDQELAIARAGCAVMDIERAGSDSATSNVDSLKHWCGSRLHDPAYRGWVIFRFPDIFSCFNQDQEMDRVDFVNLAERLRQNTAQEKLSNRWLDHLLNGQTFTHCARARETGGTDRCNAGALNLANRTGS